MKKRRRQMADETTLIKSFCGGAKEGSWEKDGSWEAGKLGR